MEEFNLSNCESAPYIELDDYKAPVGINSYFVKMNDGIKLRVCHWIKSDKETKGTILLQQGHNEFIEKYYETIKEFLDKNYSVIAFDWRGQGLSERTTSFTERAFIKSFKRHDQDLKYILEKVINKYFQKPIIGIGHSMGGCLMLSAFYNHPKIFEKGILSAPMLGFKNEKFLRTASSIMNLFKKDHDYLIGSKPNMGIETPFEINDLTSDISRYERALKLVRKKPELRLWGITNSFAKAVNARFKIIRQKGWAETINTKILIINSLNDRVVDANKTIIMSKRLKNNKLINFQECEHEVFMEKDIHRKRMWEDIDSFLN